MKHRKIIFFIKIKIYHRISNMVVHSCWQIHFIVMSYLTKDQKHFKHILKRIWNRFWNKRRRKKKERRPHLPPESRPKLGRSSPLAAAQLPPSSSMCSTSPPTRCPPCWAESTRGPQTHRPVGQPARALPLSLSLPLIDIPGPHVGGKYSSSTLRRERAGSGRRRHQDFPRFPSRHVNRAPIKPQALFTPSFFPSSCLRLSPSPLSTASRISPTCLNSRRRGFRSGCPILARNRVPTFATWCRSCRALLLAF